MPGTDAYRSQSTLLVSSQTGSTSYPLSCWQTLQHLCQQVLVSAILGPVFEILALELVNPEPETAVLELEDAAPGSALAGR